MRKFILITAFVVVSASAQAGISRGLTLASNDASATVEQSKAAEAPTSAARQQPSIPQQSGQNPQQNKACNRASVATGPRDATGRPKDAAAEPDRRREIRGGRQGRNAETPG